MNTYNPYEFHNGKLGVQVRYLTYGDNSHQESLKLIGERGLQLRVTRGSIIKLRPQGPGFPTLVQFDTLPYDWQTAITEKWGAAPKFFQKTLFERLYNRSMTAFDFYSLYKFKDETSLTVENIDEYTLNASVLETIGRIYEERRKLRRELKGEVRSIWSIITVESNRFRVESGHSLPESEPRLRQKFNEFIREGYKCLIHKNHKKQNAKVVTEEMEKLLNDMFAGINHKPTYEELSRIYEGFVNGYVEVINNETGECYNPKDFPKVSNSTVYNYLSKWQNRIGTELARSGDRQKYMAKFKPYHKLDQPKFAGSLISIDDRQPVFEYEKGKRLWFYNGIDLGSEAFTCWVHGKTKEGIIVEFYRQMVRNYAQWGLSLPAELEGELSLNSSFKDTFLQEGNMFQYVRIEANNARGKRIEQYYRPLRYQYEKQREGWLARPFALSEANQASAGVKKLIPYDEIVEGCLLDIQKWNNSEHSKIKGMSRWDVFLAMQNPELKPINYHGILPYLGFKTQTSVNTGIINFRSKKYLLGINGVIAVGNRLLNLMTQVEGKDVEIFWLDDNFGETLKAHIYIGNRFVCEAIEQPGYNRAKIEQTPEDLVNRELMSKYVNTVDSFGRRVKNNLDKVTVIDNRPRTIGSSFVMPGVKHTIIDVEPAKVLEDFESEETELTGVETPFKRDFKDRF